MSLHIYGVREYDKDVLVHGYIPCTHDGEEGFCDAIGDSFFNVHDFFEMLSNKYKNATWTWE